MQISYHFVGIYATFYLVYLYTFILSSILIVLYVIPCIFYKPIPFFKRCIARNCFSKWTSHSKYILTKNPSSLYWLFLNMPIFTASSIDRLYNERIKKSSIFFYTNFRDSTNGRIKTYSKNPLKSCSKCYNIPPCHSCTF